MLKTGKMTEANTRTWRTAPAPVAGPCSFFGTANTMCCLAEALA